MRKWEVWQGEVFRTSPVYIADNFISRFRGLMFRKELESGEGLLLTDCPAIHCCFMRFTIDVVYLDQERRVLYKESVKPFRIGKNIKGARHVLELAEGMSEGLILGESISIREVG